ncbi:MAG: RdgB/HAM1 family non-canonical purine NTP pyrophosphatase [Candidatus Goldiibacteriota bacterium]
MTKIVIASNNKDKIKEIKKIMGKSFKTYSMSEIGYNREIKETGRTLEENALIKARAVKKTVKDMIVVSDDSGLEVDYIAKAPGVYSARFAGPGCSYEDNNKKLLKIMKGLPRKERKAEFVTIAAVIFPDGTEKTARGSVKGRIAEELCGAKGFGYDPVFFVPEHRKTYAQMTPELKNRVSHRRKAFEKAAEIIKKKLKKQG